MSKMGLFGPLKILWDIDFPYKRLIREVILEINLSEMNATNPNQHIPRNSQAN